MTRVVISPLAEADLSDITDYYLIEAGVVVATAFMTSWDICTAHIAQFPESGSPRLAEKVRISQLRVWPVKGFPHLAIYLVEDGRVTIVRVLHAARDIPEKLHD